MLPQRVQTRFHSKRTYTILSSSACASIAHEIYLCNVIPYLISWTALHRKIIYNVILIFVGQYCARGLATSIIPVHSWKRTFLSKITLLYNVVSTTKLGKHCIRHSRKIVYTRCPTIRLTVWDDIAQENYLFNIGPEHAAMILKENNLHNFVLVCFGPRLHTKQGNLWTACRHAETPIRGAL